MWFEATNILKLCFFFCFVWWRVSVSRFLENGYSMLERRTTKRTWRNFTISTAPGLKSHLCLIVKKCSFAGRIKGSWLLNVSTSRTNKVHGVTGVTNCCVYVEWMENVTMGALIIPSQETAAAWHVSTFVLLDVLYPEIPIYSECITIC